MIKEAMKYVTELKEQAMEPKIMEEHTVTRNLEDMT